MFHDSMTFCELSKHFFNTFKQYYFSLYEVNLSDKMIMKIAIWACLQLLNDREFLESWIFQWSINFSHYSHIIKYALLDDTIDDEKEKKFMNFYYNEVKYFVTHMFEKNHYLTYVQNYKNMKHNVNDRNEIVMTTYEKLRVYEWINVSSIECLIDLFVNKNTKYIIDKYSFTFRMKMKL